MDEQQQRDLDQLIADKIRPEVASADTNRSMAGEAVATMRMDPAESRPLGQVVELRSADVSGADLDESQRARAAALREAHQVLRSAGLFGKGDPVDPDVLTAVAVFILDGGEDYHVHMRLATIRDDPEPDDPDAARWVPPLTETERVLLRSRLDAEYGTIEERITHP